MYFRFIMRDDPCRVHRWTRAKGLGRRYNVERTALASILLLKSIDTYVYLYTCVKLILTIDVE